MRQEDLETWRGYAPGHRVIIKRPLVEGVTEGLILQVLPSEPASSEPRFLVESIADGACRVDILGLADIEIRSVEPRQLIDDLHRRVVQFAPKRGLGIDFPDGVPEDAPIEGVIHDARFQDGRIRLTVAVRVEGNPRINLFFADADLTQCRITPCHRAGPMAPLPMPPLP